MYTREQVEEILETDRQETRRNINELDVSLKTVNDLVDTIREVLDARMDDLGIDINDQLDELKISELIKSNLIWIVNDFKEDIVSEIDKLLLIEADDLLKHYQIINELPN